MKADLLSRLRCPRCTGTLREETSEGGGEAVENFLRCAACGSAYPIRHGIPRMVIDPAQRETERAFGSQWSRRQKGQFEEEVLFGLTAGEELQLFFDSLDLQPSDLQGRWVLDAGCGSGRLTRGLTAYGAEVVGLDLAPTVELVVPKGEELPNLHLTQGSLLDIPLADETFDIVWSMGVIHHTGDTPRAFANLARLVRPGGRLYVWVYSSEKLSLYKVLRDALRVSHRLPQNLLFYLSYAMAPPLKLYHSGKFLLRRVRGRPITARERREGRIRTIAFELHDDLAPPFQTRHTAEEVCGWFREAGFEYMEVVDEVGVRGIKRSAGLA